MFFKAEHESKLNKIIDKKSAYAVLNEIIREEFEKLKDEMVKALVELNIPEDEYDEYIQDLYQKVQDQAKNLFNKTLKEKLVEIKNQLDDQNTTIL